MFHKRLGKRHQPPKFQHHPLSGRRGFFLMDFEGKCEGHTWRVRELIRVAQRRYAEVIVLHSCHGLPFIPDLSASYGATFLRLTMGSRLDSECARQHLNRYLQLLGLWPAHGGGTGVGEMKRAPASVGELPFIIFSGVMPPTLSHLSAQLRALGAPCIALVDSLATASSTHPEACATLRANFTKAIVPSLVRGIAINESGDIGIVLPGNHNEGVHKRSH